MSSPLVVMHIQGRKRKQKKNSPRRSPTPPRMLRQYGKALKAMTEKLCESNSPINKKSQILTSPRSIVSEIIKWETDDATLDCMHREILDRIATKSTKAILCF